MGYQEICFSSVGIVIVDMIILGVVHIASFYCFQELKEASHSKMSNCTSSKEATLDSVPISVGKIVGCVLAFLPCRALRFCSTFVNLAICSIAFYLFFIHWKILMAPKYFICDPFLNQIISDSSANQNL